MDAGNDHGSTDGSSTFASFSIGVSTESVSIAGPAYTPRPLKFYGQLLFLLVVKGHQLRVVLLLIDNPFMKQVQFRSYGQAYYFFRQLGLEINLELRLDNLLLRNRLYLDPSRGNPGPTL